MDMSDTTGMTDEQKDEYLFWRYNHEKKRYRRHFRKPVRKVRRVIKRHKGKGKGKRAHQRDSYFDTLQEGTWLDAGCYMARKGYSRAHSRSSGKGYGRKGNPKGSNGEIMECFGCKSRFHLQRDCPHNRGGGAGAGSGSASAHVGYVEVRQGETYTGPSFMVATATETPIPTDSTWNVVPREDSDATVAIEDRMDTDVPPPPQPHPAWSNYRSARSSYGPRLQGTIHHRQMDSNRIHMPQHAVQASRH